jgi:hypothetical protein
LSRHGDECATWDLPKAETGDPEAVAAVREAERIFEEARARGATAYKIDTERSIERMERFDKTAEQIVMVPRVVGG